jgi:hypothetical protein
MTNFLITFIYMISFRISFYFAHIPYLLHDIRFDYSISPEELRCPRRISPFQHIIKSLAPCNDEDHERYQHDECILPAASLPAPDGADISRAWLAMRQIFEYGLSPPSLPFISALIALTDEYFRVCRAWSPRWLFTAGTAAY